MTFVMQVVILQTLLTLLLVQFTDAARKTKKQILSGEGKERCLLAIVGMKLPWPLGPTSSTLYFHVYHESPYISCCIEAGGHRNIFQS